MARTRDERSALPYEPSPDPSSRHSGSQSDTSSWLAEPELRNTQPQPMARLSLPWEATLVDSVSTPDLQDRTRDRFSTLVAGESAKQSRDPTTRHSRRVLRNMPSGIEEEHEPMRSHGHLQRIRPGHPTSSPLAIQLDDDRGVSPIIPPSRSISSDDESTNVDISPSNSPAPPFTSPLHNKEQSAAELATDIDVEDEKKNAQAAASAGTGGGGGGGGGGGDAIVPTDPYGHLPLEQAALLKEQVETQDGKYGIFSIYKFATRNDLLIVALSIVCSIISGAAMPLMTIIFGGMAQIFSEYFLGLMTYDGFLDRMTGYCLYFVYIGIASFIATYVFTVGFMYTGEHITSKIREEYLASCLRQNMGFYDNTGAGEVVQRITADTNQIQDGISEKISTTLSCISSLIASFIIAFFFYWKLTCILFSTVVALLINTIVGTIFITKYTLPSIQAYMGGAMLADEVMSSVRNIIAFGSQDKMAKRYLSHLEKAESLGFKTRHITGWVIAVVMSMLYFNFGLGFWQGSGFYVRGEATLQDILTIMMAIMIGASSMAGIAPNLQAFIGALSASSKILSTIDRKSPIDPTSEDGVILPHLRGHIRLENIKHIYPSRPNVVVMNDVSLDIPAGKTTALVGASGSGKSTIVGLLERFYSPAEGNLYVDGHDIKTLNLRWLRQQISLVSQEPTLFSTTIFENIKFGLIGSKFEHESEERKKELVIEAAKMANAHDFISVLDDGYSTDVGESGFLLSGGQKQRIAIARAIVSDPKILLLDEATSALDTKSEGVVQEALELAAAGRTTITIAHRLSTIRDADNIVVMIKGEIVEQGTHDQLLAHKDAYYKLVEAQKISSQNTTQEDEEDEEDELVLLRRKSRARRPSSGRRRSNTKSRRSMFAESGTFRQSVFFRPSIWRGSNVFSGQEIFNEPEPDFGLSLNRPQSRFSMASSFEDPSDEEQPSHSLWTLIKFVAAFNRTDKLWVALGVFASILCGGAMPVSAVLYGKQVTALTQPLLPETADSIRDDSNFWSLMYLMLGLVQLFANALSGFAFGKAAERLIRRARYDTFRSLLRQDISFFDRDENSAGALTSFLAVETQQMAGLSGASLGTMVSAITTLIAGITLAICIGWKLALVCVATMPVLLGCGFYRVWMLARFQRRAKGAYAQSAAYASEAISAIRTVATLTREEDVWTRYHESLASQQKRSLKSIATSSIVFAASQSLVFFCSALGFWYGGSLIAKLEYSMFQFFVCFMAVINGSQSAGTFFSLAPDMGKAHLSAGELKDLLDRKPNVDTWSEEGKVMAKLDGKVEFKNVHFRYPTRPEQPILRGLDLEILPGQYVALVGGSGCGKSTTISLMERFYDPLAGSIFVDDKNINSLNINDYRSFVALVSQEPTLYSGTIRDNVAFGAAGTEVTDADIERACRDANIHDFVTSLPDGYNTVLGPKGGMLSGGQKQRIAIARALVRNPKVLLLDEATSALDSESEHVVQEALDKASKGRTTITIAHRLSTVQHADCIYVLDQGRVVEKGTHRELLRKQGRYAELVGMQSLEKKQKDLDEKL